METIKLETPAIVEPVPAPAPTTDTKAVAPPKTTAEQDRHSGGQRRINMIWEVTQACIAISVIWGTFGVTIWLIVNEPETGELKSVAFTFLVGVVSTVVGFYFGRTNHQRIGGVELGR